MKRVLMVLAVAVAAVMVSRNLGGAAPEARAPAEKWRYAMVRLPMHNSTFNIQHQGREAVIYEARPNEVNPTFSDLTLLGERGWELVSVNPVPEPNPPHDRGSEEYYFVFKQPQR